MSIAIVGMPASGKTTVGKALASGLSVPFVDTDALVESQAGKPIREIFADDGEPRFRALEEWAVQEALSSGSAVVALGGGAVLSPATREVLAHHVVVWLDVSVKTLTRRAGMNQLRPLLLGDARAHLDELAEQRRMLYEEVATWRIDAESGSPTKIAEAIQAMVASRNVDTIGVETDHPYEVIVSHRASSLVKGLVPGASRVAILCPSVLASQAHMIASDLPNPLIIEVPEGEEAKTITALETCWRTLASEGFTRNDAIIGLGGGATTDLAGFVAATFLRGVRYVAMPTTVLGMADAAVGGKTGINLPEGKNLVGSFYEPSAVLCDLDYLRDLPKPEIVSGLGEIVKCGFIADTHILDLVTADPADCVDTQSLRFADVLTRAIKVKADVVSRDFREVGGRGLVGREALNYGHTLAHAIEKIEGFTWAHGNAVAVGMVYAAEVAHALGRVDADIVNLHREVLDAVGLPVSWGGGTWSEVRHIMSLDKKARGATLRLVLLTGLGATSVVANIEESVLEGAFSRVHS